MLAGTPAPRLSDLPFLALLLAPYLLLSLLAWRAHRSRAVSSWLFGATLVLALAGMTLLALDCLRFHRVPEHRLVQRFTPVVVPLLQLAAAMMAGLAVELQRLWKGHGRSQASQSQRH